jgi:site-specific DNA recombinase
MDKLGLLYRVSSQPQESDGGGLDVQKQLGKNISEKLGLEMVEFNEGVQSSYKVEINQRPVLVELLTEIQKKDGIRKVWVFNTDRLGRYSNSWYSILKVFIDYGVEVYIGEDTIPYDLSNSVDKLTMGVLSLISQYDNELRRMRSVLGKRNSLRSGNSWVGGTVPFGYEVKKKELRISKIEGEYVKKVFEMYDRGKSAMDIKIYLDKQTNIEPRRSKKGWNVGTVLSMLKKEIYVGVQKWEWKEKLPNGEVTVIEKFNVKVPNIVDEDLWNRVQKKMEDNYPTLVNGEVRKSLLKGLLVCPKCKLRLGHRFKKTNHYYGKCSEYNWRKVGGKIDTKHCVLKKSLRMEELDEKILNEVTTVMLNSKRVREDFKTLSLSPKFQDEEVIRKKVSSLKRNLRGKTQELEKVEEEFLNIEFDIRLGKLSKQQGEKLNERFVNHISSINEEIEGLNHQINVLTNSNEWIDWIDKMNNEFEKFAGYDIQKKNHFLKEIIKRIEVEYVPQSKSHKIRVIFNLPIVGDSISYTGYNELGQKTYSINEGKNYLETEMGLVTYKTSSKDKYKRKLIDRVISLIEVEGLSLTEVSERLNSEKLYPTNGGKWYKSKVSSFFNYHKKKRTN